MTCRLRAGEAVVTVPALGSWGVRGLAERFDGPSAGGSGSSRGEGPAAEAQS